MTLLPLEAEALLGAMATTGIRVDDRKFEQAVAVVTAELARLRALEGVCLGLDYDLGAVQAERDELRTELARLRALEARVGECTNRGTIGPISAHYVLTGAPFGVTT